MHLTNEYKACKMTGVTWEAFSYIQKPKINDSTDEGKIVVILITLQSAIILHSAAPSR